MRAILTILAVSVTGCCAAPQVVEAPPRIIEHTIVERVPVAPPATTAKTLDKVKREVDRLRAVTAPKPQRKPEPTP